MSSNLTDLSALLRQMIDDLSDPTNHYWIDASHAEIRGEKRWMFSLYLHEECVFNPEVTDGMFLCDLYLTPNFPQPTVRATIPLAEIWRVQTSDSNQFTGENPVYYRPDVMDSMFERMKARLKRASFSK